MAIRTISTLGGNYNSTTTWVGGIVPTAADDVVATGTSGPLTLVATGPVGGGVGYCKSLNLTGYVGILTIHETLFVSGNVTLGSGMTFSTLSTWYLNINATSSITTNGIYIPNFTFSANITITLIDNLHIGKTFSVPAYNQVTINNNNIYIHKDFYITYVGRLSGTAPLRFVGTGVFAGIGGVYDTIFSPVIIDSGSGTTTIVGEISIGNSLVYVSGTVVKSGNVYLYITGALTAVTINFSPIITWENISINPTQTINILSDLYCNDLNLQRPTLIGNNIIIYRSFLSLGSKGTTKLIIAGTGTWITPDYYYFLENDLIINTTGTFTLATPTTSYLNYSIGKITYISGTIVQNGTLNIITTASFNTSGMSFTNLNITNGTITLDSTLNVSNTLTLGSSGNVIFAGSSGFTTNILSVVPSTTRTITLKDSNTYTVNSALTFTGFGAGSRLSIISSSSTVRAIFTLNPLATQIVTNTDAVRIDSGFGQTIACGPTAVLVDTINWYYPYSPSTGNFLTMFDN